MTNDRRSLFDSAIDWFAILGQSLRAAIALPMGDGTTACESVQGTDPDFEGWLVNDPMVTLNPTSRYGDDATDFLAASELENSDLGRTD